jgi:hypothetical protein
MIVLMIIRLVRRMMNRQSAETQRINVHHQ